MEQIERIGVSVDKKLLSAFDKLISGRGYQSRSEAIRDLIRQQISSEQLKNPRAKAIAAVFLVYEHHSTKLMEKLGEAHQPSALARAPDDFVDAHSSRRA